MAKPKVGDYLVLQTGVALIQSATPKSIDYVSSYSNRKDPESMPVLLLTPAGVKTWKLKDRIVSFRVSPSWFPEYAELICAKTTADAGAKYKRTLGLRLLRVPKDSLLGSLDWCEVNQAAAKELTKLSQTADPSNWLSINILGYA